MPQANFKPERDFPADIDDEDEGVEWIWAFLDAAVDVLCMLVIGFAIAGLFLISVPVLE